MTIGQWLKEEREKAGLSLRQLAEKVDMSNSYLSKIERDVKFPSTDTLVKLGKALNAPIENILAHEISIKLEKNLHNFFSDCEIKSILEICKIRDVDLVTYLIECILIQVSNDAEEYGIFERNPWLKCGKTRF